MALNDIYRVVVHYELPTSAASFSLYYKETTVSSTGFLDTEKMGEAFDIHLAVEIQDILSDDCNQPEVTCEKVFGPTKAPIHLIEHGAQVGSRAGPSLPSNNSLVCRLHQATFTQRSNGRIRLPGVPDFDTDGSTMTAAYQTGPIQAFINKLAIAVPELSAGTGVWTLGIISAKVRDVALPAKDWAGAFAPVTSLVMNTIIGILKSRRTRARGRSV